MVFMNFSSAFNCILPSRLFHKFSSLGLHHNICLLLRGFVRSINMGPITLLHCLWSSTKLATNSFLVLSVYTHNCTPIHKINVIIKFADDTTVAGLISEGDESAYREEADRLVCS